MKFDKTLMTCVSANVHDNLVPMLLGEPGIGKSSWVEALATKLKTKCFTLACNQLADKADLTGARLTKTATSTTTSRSSILTQSSMTPLSTLLLTQMRHLSSLWTS